MQILKDNRSYHATWKIDSNSIWFFIFVFPSKGIFGLDIWTSMLIWATSTYSSFCKYQRGPNLRIENLVTRSGWVLSLSYTFLGKNSYISVGSSSYTYNHLGSISYTGLLRKKFYKLYLIFLIILLP